MENLWQRENHRHRKIDFVLECSLLPPFCATFETDIGKRGPSKACANSRGGGRKEGKFARDASLPPNSRSNSILKRFYRLVLPLFAGTSLYLPGYFFTKNDTTDIPSNRSDGILLLKIYDRWLSLSPLLPRVDYSRVATRVSRRNIRRHSSFSILSFKLRLRTHSGSLSYPDRCCTDEKTSRINHKLGQVTFLAIYEI